jgi:hypothetical protein
MGYPGQSKVKEHLFQRCPDYEFSWSSIAHAFAKPLAAAKSSLCKLYHTFNAFAPKAARSAQTHRG